MFGNISKVVRNVIKVLMSKLKDSPWAEKLETSKTIINLIKGLGANGKKVKWQEAVDVGCAVN